MDQKKRITRYRLGQLRDKEGNNERYQFLLAQLHTFTLPLYSVYIIGIDDILESHVL